MARARAPPSPPDPPHTPQYPPDPSLPPQPRGRHAPPVKRRRRQRSQRRFDLPRKLLRLVGELRIGAGRPELRRSIAPHVPPASYAQHPRTGVSQRVRGDDVSAVGPLDRGPPVQLLLAKHLQGSKHPLEQRPYLAAVYLYLRVHERRLPRRIAPTDRAVPPLPTAPPP